MKNPFDDPNTTSAHMMIYQKDPPLVQSLNTSPGAQHMITPAELEDRITYHGLNEEQLERVSTIRSHAHVFGLSIIQDSQPSREQSLAITHLEKALMWANKGIAREKRSEQSTT